MFRYFFTQLQIAETWSKGLCETSYFSVEIADGLDLQGTMES